MAKGEKQKILLDIRQDRFVQRLLKKLPEDMRDSFTDEQLLRLKYAIDMTSWGIHEIDIRGFVGIGRWKYYYVLLMGKDRRRNKRLDMALRVTEIIFLTLAIFVVCLAILGLIFLLQSTLGFEIVEGGAGGLINWIKDSF
ncbi:hypothetical protein MNBD_NITROSPINAE02-1494 [hydrothermal vent metagenome]|uniref:3-phosphoshikimate 1-carboxyvinyltransferase n=1 Tax=hydrothermal vent metagenome TaxID=652676 RepID=A0A3B1BW98_9ZZZZ